MFIMGLLVPLLKALTARILFPYMCLLDYQAELFAVEENSI